MCANVGDDKYVILFYEQFDSNMFPKNTYKIFFTDIAPGLDGNLWTMAIWEEVEDIIL